MERSGLTFIVFAAVIILVGLAFWSPVGGNISTLTGTQTAANTSFTFPAEEVAKELPPCGQAVVTISAWNATGGEPIPSTNYTTSTATGADGYLAAFLTPSADTPYANQSTLVTCTYRAKGYINEAGTRSVAVLIPLFLAMLIAFSALPDVREWVKGVFSQ